MGDPYGHFRTLSRSRKETSQQTCTYSCTCPSQATPHQITTFALVPIRRPLSATQKLCSALQLRLLLLLLQFIPLLQIPLIIIILLLLLLLLVIIAMFITLSLLLLSLLLLQLLSCLQRPCRPRGHATGRAPLPPSRDTRQ